MKKDAQYVGEITKRKNLSLIKIFCIFILNKFIFCLNTKFNIF